MHRRFAAWLVGQPWRAFFIGACLAALSPQGFSPFALVASAAAVLVILYGDSPGAATRGITVAVVSFAVGMGTLLSIQQPLVVAAGLAGLAFLAPSVLGILLKRVGSLTLCFQLAVLGMWVLLLGVYAVLDNPSAVWEELLREAVDSLKAGGVVLANPEQMITGFARTMWGAYAALGLLGTLSAVFLGRWWQSLLEAPGGFGSEYRELRLGRTLGVVSVAIVAAAAFLEIEVVDCLSWVAVSALAYQGLAAAHRRKAARQMGRSGLVVIYVFLLVPLSAFIMVTLLAAWGAADNWRQFKGLAGA
jgi:hypothetical protein